MNLKKLAIATLASLSITPAVATADIIEMTMDGLFTLSTSGVVVTNTDALGNSFSGNRTNITGTITLDTATGNGTGTINSFDLLGSGPATFSNIFFGLIGDGVGGPGSLTVYDMDLSWAGNTFQAAGIMNAAGLFDNLSVGTISSGCAACASSETPAFSTGPGGSSIIGPTPWAWDAFTVNYNTTRSNRSSIGPITVDPFGSPLISGPLAGSTIHLDFTTLSVTSVTASVVPVPTAAWLFGSGLISLIGIARRK